MRTRTDIKISTRQGLTTPSVKRFNGKMLKSLSREALKGVLPSSGKTVARFRRRNGATVSPCYRHQRGFASEMLERLLQYPESRHSLASQYLKRWAMNDIIALRKNSRHFRPRQHGDVRHGPQLQA
jgi:hypothetical protein